jgi:transcriptional regulator GlxA family with amidase domain
MLYENEKVCLSWTDNGETMSAIIRLVEERNSSGYDSMMLSKINRFVNEHLGERISLTDVAGVMCMHPNSVSRFFRKYKKQKFSNYLSGKRIEKACALLTVTRDSITSIAFECGYDHLSTFNSNFLKLKGLSPSEFRRRS